MHHELADTKSFPVSFEHPVWDIELVPDADAHAESHGHAELDAELDGFRNAKRNCDINRVDHSERLAECDAQRYPFRNDVTVTKPDTNSLTHAQPFAFTDAEPVAVDLSIHGVDALADAKSYPEYDSHGLGDGDPEPHADAVQHREPVRDGDADPHPEPLAECIAEPAIDDLADSKWERLADS